MSDMDRFNAAVAFANERLAALAEAPSSSRAETGDGFTITAADTHQAGMMLLSGLPEPRSCMGLMSAYADHAAQQISDGAEPRNAIFGTLQVALLIGSLLGDPRD